jgi:hypothetical protein
VVREVTLGGDDEQCHEEKATDEEDRACRGAHFSVPILLELPRRSIHSTPAQATFGRGTMTAGG